MNKELIPERLRNARENLGISMAEASRRLNLSKIGYCRYEYGERTPSMQTIEVIAQCFGTSVDYIIGNTDDMSPDTIVISKASSPEMYEFVRSLSTSDASTMQRLMAYYNKINQPSK